MRVSLLIGLHQELNLDCSFLGVFQSSVEDMNRHVLNQELTFPLISDEKRTYYKKFGVETSTLGYIIGALKIPTLLLARRKGFKISNPFGPKTTIPADFLIDENGIIQKAYYGKDITDHLDLEIVESFF